MAIEENYTKLQILGFAYQSLGKAEGWTDRMLEMFRDITNLDMMEEMEVNIVANQDYISDQKAKVKEDMTEADIEAIYNDHIADDCNRGDDYETQ